MVFVVFLTTTCCCCKDIQWGRVISNDKVFEKPLLITLLVAYNPPPLFKAVFDINSLFMCFFEKKSVMDHKLWSVIA